MVFKKHNPGCASNPEECAGCRCTFADDTFNGAASTTVSGWTENVGDWSTDGSALTVATSNALITNDTAHPFNGISMKASVKVRGSADDDEFRVIVNKEDDNNYIYAQLRISTSGCGDFEVWEVTGGVHTQLGETLVTNAALLNVWHIISLCFDVCDDDSETDIYGTACIGRTRLIARVAFDSGTIHSMEDTTFAGHQFGIRAGLATATITGTPLFDDFIVERVASFADDHCKQCGIEDGCSIGSDGFFRDDSSDLGCMWEQVSGTSSIESDQLKLLADTVVKFQTPHPREQPHWINTVQVKAVANGDKAWFIFDYVDSSNYHFVELTFGAGAFGGEFKVFKRTGGSNAQVGGTVAVTATIGGFLSVSVCFIYGYIQAVIDGDFNTHAIDETSQPHNGRFSGLGSSTVTGASMLFDNFATNRGFSSRDLDCGQCDGGTAACPTPCSGSGQNASKLYMIEASGILEGLQVARCEAKQCNYANGTFIVAHTSSGSGNCSFLTDELEPIADCTAFVPPGKLWYWSLDLTDGVPPLLSVRAALNWQGGAPTLANSAVWRDDHATGIQFDCLEFVALNLPHAGNATEYCDGRTAVVNVTSL